MRTIICNGGSAQQITSQEQQQRPPGIRLHCRQILPKPTAAGGEVGKGDPATIQTKQNQVDSCGRLMDILEWAF